MSSSPLSLATFAVLVLAATTVTLTAADQTWLVTQSGFTYFVNGQGPNPTMYARVGEVITINTDSTTATHPVCASTTRGPPSNTNAPFEPSRPGYSDGPSAPSTCVSNGGTATVTVIA